MAEVNEESTSVLSIGFVNEDGDAAVPTAASYRIDDEESGESLKAETVLAGLASSMTIVMASEDNAIVNQRHEYEIHIITIVWDYMGAHGASHGTGQMRFKVLNIYGVE